MKYSRTILVVATISLTLFVAAGTHFPSSLTQRTSAKVRKETIKERPAARVRSRVETSQQAILSGHTLPFLRTSDDLGRLSASTAMSHLVTALQASPDPGGMQQGNLQSNEQTAQARGEGGKADRKPKEERLTKAHSFNGDLRDLPHRKPVQRERPELEPPDHRPVTVEGVALPPAPSAPGLPAPAVQAPAPGIVFEGLDRENWGAGSPPDTNGDVGPNYYIQSVNTSVGVYRKSDGFREAAFTFDTLMSQGNFGNLCDTDNFGDPVVLYDTFDDRWILTDFAFLTDVSGNVLSPAYQCFAVSMNGNPLSGGRNFYSIQAADLLNDYPKLGIWTDGLYMSANMFSFGAGSTFQGVRVWAFNKAQMYAGSPTRSSR